MINENFKDFIPIFLILILLLISWFQPVFLSKKQQYQEGYARGLKDGEERAAKRVLLERPDGTRYYGQRDNIPDGHTIVKQKS